MTVLWILLVILILLLALGLGLLYFVFWRRPTPDLSTPETLEKSRWSAFSQHILAGCRWVEAQEVQPLQVVSYDGKLLYGRFIPCENARGTIVFFHGYRSSYVIDLSASLDFYHSLGLNLLICDQRAHGQSQGHFITFGVKERYDVLSWVTYLSMMLGEAHPIFLGGLSMGATTVLMASDLAFPANVRGIIADCGFTSPGDIIRHLLRTHYHLPEKPVTVFLNIFTRVFAGFGLDQWSTVEAVKNTALPILLFHGLEDHFVPSNMSEAVYEACRSEKTLIEVPGANHGVSYLVDMPRYQQALREFVDRHIQ